MAEISPAVMHFCGEANLNVNLGCFPELPTGSTDLKIAESVLEERESAGENNYGPVCNVFTSQAKPWAGRKG